MPTVPATSSQQPSPSDSAAGEELRSLLYPEGGGAAAAAAGKNDDPDHDPEFDGPEAEGAAGDPDAEGDDDGDGDDVSEGKKNGKKKGESAAEDADEDEDDDGDDEAEAAEGDGKGEDDDAEDDDPDADDEKALRAKAKFSAEQQKVVDKLLGKKTAAQRDLRAKSTKLESQVAALSTEVDTLRAGLPAPIATRESPLADVANETELATRERNAVSLRYWLMRNRDGGELPDGKGGKTTISPERRDELLAETDELMMVHLPARRDFIKQRRIFDVEARKAFPDLGDSKSALSLRVDAVLRQYPALQSMPEARLFLADALANQEARTKGVSAAARAAAGAGAAGAGKDKTQSRRPPRTEGRPGVAARVNGNSKRAEQAHARFESTGRDDDNVVLAELIGGGRRR